MKEGNVDGIEGGNELGKKEGLVEGASLNADSLLGTKLYDD